MEHNMGSQRMLPIELNEDDSFYVRRALNYALWTIENHSRVTRRFAEKAIRTVFEIIEISRTCHAQDDALFVYWLLHEIYWHDDSVTELRIEAGIAAIQRIGEMFGISSVNNHNPQPN